MRIHKPLAFSLCFFLACCAAPKDLAFRLGYMRNASPSLPVGWWRITDDRPDRGVYVALCPPSPKPFLMTGGADNCGGMAPLIKQIVGIPGDIVEVNKIGVRVNGGPYLPHSVPLVENSRGYQLVPLYGTHRLVGFWLSGQHPESYDSRYTGQASGSSFLRTLRPIWVSADIRRG